MSSLWQDRDLSTCQTRKDRLYFYFFGAGSIFSSCQQSTLSIVSFSSGCQDGEFWLLWK